MPVFHRLKRRIKQLKIRHKGMGLFLGRVLPHRHKINGFSANKLSYVSKIL